MPFPILNLLGLKDFKMILRVTAAQCCCTQLTNEDLEQIDTDDLEEMDPNGSETPTNALIVTDGIGYDWSYQAEERPTDFAQIGPFIYSVNGNEEDNNQVNDRYKAVGLWLDDSVFKSKVSETITSVPKIETTASKTSKNGLEKPKTIRSSALLIEE
ncbi:hypothetical protein Tco_0646210 [Tanacetum coccineum]